MTPPNIPFYRPLYGPNHTNGPTYGNDVIAVKRALSRAGYMAWATFDSVYNLKAVTACKSFQAAKGITATGNYGPATHKALVNTHRQSSTTEWAFDTLAAKLYNEARIAGTKPTEAQIRAYMVSVLYQMYKVRDTISYSQNRPIYPIAYRITDPTKARVLDCSGMSIYCYWLADQYFQSRGVRVPSPDPVYKYSGYGNTYSLDDGGTQVSESNCTLGDLAFYKGHVAVVVALNPVRVISHGSEAGPLYLELRYRSDLLQIRHYNVRTEV